MRRLSIIALAFAMSAQVRVPGPGGEAAASAPVTPPAYVSACAGDDGGGTNTVAVTTNCSLAAGGTAATDVLTVGHSVYVVVFAQTGCSGFNFTVTDVALNTYSIIGAKVDQVGSMCSAQFNVTNAPNGSAINVYTVTASTAVTDLSISTFQMSGASAPLLQTSSTGTGGGSAVNSAAISPSVSVAAGTIVLVGATCYPQVRTFTADSGYTIPSGSISSSLKHIAIEYQGFSTAPANQAPGPTMSGAASFMVTLASTFK